MLSVLFKQLILGIPFIKKPEHCKKKPPECSEKDSVHSGGVLSLDKKAILQL